MKLLFERIMSCWEEHVVSDMVSYYARNATTWKVQPGTVTYSLLWAILMLVQDPGVNIHLRR